MGGPAPGAGADPCLTAWPSRSSGHRLTSHHVIGGPDTVPDRLQELLDRTGADELMVSGYITDHADRCRSYEIVADVARGLRPRRLSDRSRG